MRERNPYQNPAMALLTPAEMAGADALAPQFGVPGLTLMEAAGRAVARAAMRLTRPVRTLVLVGPGNNGGDGYVAARRLAEFGWPVSLAILAPPRRGSDAAVVATRWRGPTPPFDPREAARADLVIDAVFGAGLSRPLEGRVVETLRAARRVLAVDVPSGLDGATGAALGEVRAAEATVTFCRAKPGHILFPGRALCGALEIAQIGMPAEVLAKLAPRTWCNHPDLWTLPVKRPQGHKYTSGHVTILGSADMPGAARLAASAAPASRACWSVTGLCRSCWWTPGETPGCADPAWGSTPPAKPCQTCCAPVVLWWSMPTA
jgi:hydroxyethylthiazole kinase-like uncharacterized protein yjeF